MEGGPFGFAGTRTHHSGAHSCKPFPGTRRELGHWRVRLGPGTVTWSLPLGSTDSGKARGVCEAVGSSSFWERGGKDFAKLGNERKKRTK